MEFSRHGYWSGLPFPIPLNVHIVPQTKKCYTILGLYNFSSVASHSCGWNLHPSQRQVPGCYQPYALTVAFSEGTSDGTRTRED